jgi:hypothetical protein
VRSRAYQAKAVGAGKTPWMLTTRHFGLVTVQLFLAFGLMSAPWSLAGAQTNPIAAARQPGGTTTTPNLAWAGAGVEGGIVHRTTVCSSHAAGTSIATINTAITNCSTAGGGVVSLGAGTFSGGSILMKSNVTLRGQGMSTIYNVTSTSTNFFYGDGSTALLFSGAFDGSGYGQNPAQGGVPSANKRTITGCSGVAGSYPQGCTVLNLSSAPNAALTVGIMLTVWQLNDSDASVPKPGFFVSSKTGSGTSAISWEGSGESRTSAMQQRVRVTNINGATVTVTPGLFLPVGTWRTDRTPSAAWQGNDLRLAGVEDMIIRGTNGPGNQWSLIQFWQAQNCWIARTAIQPIFTGYHAGGATQNVIQIYESKNITVRDNWIGHAMGGGQGSTTTYGVSMNQASNSLVENNIFDTVESPMMFNSGATGNVVAYNYEIIGSQQEGGIQNHEVGASMNLVEGNTATKFMADVFHGNSNFITVFRNYFTATAAALVDVWSYGRFWNVIGNVLAGPAQYKSLVSDASKRSRFEGVCIRVGYPAQTASAGPVTGVAQDAEVGTSAMLWGNYCASGGTRFLSAEVPVSEPSYPNAIPGDQLLPASLYRSTRPSFFTVTGIGIVTWPPIGPDVTAGPSASGHAHKLPAQLVYEAASGNILNFNPALYGTSTGAVPPAAPSGLSVN